MSDTLGTIGPPPFAVWLRGVFAAAARDARPHDGDSSATQLHALDLALAELLAILVRDNYAAVVRLTVQDRA